MLGYAFFEMDNYYKMLAVWSHGKYVEEMRMMLIIMLNVAMIKLFNLSNVAKVVFVLLL